MESEVSIKSVNVTRSEQGVNQRRWAPETGNHPLVWGTCEIGKVINRTPRQTHHMLATGAIKCAQKKGGRWVAGRTALLKEFGGDVA
jgi:hypothetical protein